MATKRDITVAASDGLALAASLFEPEGARPVPATIIIGSATAVPRGFYAKFATFLAETGPARVLTFDYRGIGGSRPKHLAGFAARMRDWGERDSAGMLAWAHASWPDVPIRWIGHSYGGFGPVLAPNHHLVERMLSVATMSGYWGHMQGLERLKVWAIMRLAVPAIAHVLGHASGRLLGGAEDLPKGVALEFSRWCTSPGFLFDDVTLDSRSNFAAFKAPIRFCRPLDDPWCTQAALDALMTAFIAAPEVSVWCPSPEEAGQVMGHVGFFRERFRNIHWVRARDWILAPQPMV